MSEARWLVHPRPLPDESLSSWVTRLARANATLRATWLFRESPRLSQRLDFDTSDLPELHELLAHRTGLAGGASAVRALTHLGEFDALGAKVARLWLMDASHGLKVMRQRWCPRCLAEDADPYFRRAWHWTWLVRCPVHRVRLRDTCASCGQPPDVERVSWQRPVASCRSCGKHLGRTRLRPAGEQTPFVTERVQCALAVLRQGNPEHAEWWTTVSCLHRFILRAGAPNWPLFRAAAGEAAGGTPEALPKGAADAGALAFAAAWELAGRVDEVVPTLVSRLGKAFGWATRPFCSASLRPYRKTPRNLTAADVRAAVEARRAANLPLHDTGILKQMRARRNGLDRDPEFRGIVEAARAQAATNDRETLRAKLRAAHDELLARGVRPTRPALMKLAGVSREALERWEAATGETFAVSVADFYEQRVRDTVALLRQRGEPLSPFRVGRTAGIAEHVFQQQGELKQIVLGAMVNTLQVAPR